jgi:hypothetical protein
MPSGNLGVKLLGIDRLAQLDALHHYGMAAAWGELLAERIGMVESAGEVVRVTITAAPGQWCCDRRREGGGGPQLVCRTAVGHRGYFENLR